MGWKIYAFAFALLLISSWIQLPFAALRLTDVVDIPVTLIGLAGLVAFAFRRRLLIPWFWKVWLVAQILWDIGYNVTGSGDDMGRMVSVVIIALPLYLAIFLYGFRSQSLWSNS
jgi:hypothetical protein